MRLVRTLLVVLVAFAGFAAQPASAGEKPPKKPNILSTLADDFGPNCIAALGNQHVKTPHLDKIVNKGFSFRKTYCMGSMVPAVCLPSRTMVLSGKHLFHIKSGKGESNVHP